MLSARDVVVIHGQIIGPEELQGLTRNKSIDAVIAPHSLRNDQRCV